VDEDGFVLGHKIVPNDSREFVTEILLEIWKTEGRTVSTQAIYTDNPIVDSKSIQNAYKECFPEDLTELAVLLDIFHAKARVLKSMQKTHPDYRAAKADLNTIFGIIFDIEFVNIVYS
jgi:hypothetical protein